MEIKRLSNFWQGKKVLVTGHTGFKGAWLSMLLHKFGADVTGYALLPPTNPSIFESCVIEPNINSIIGDVRDADKLKNTLISCQPEIVIHMAAQPLVRLSYKEPLATYQTNIMGTANLLEAIRYTPSVRAVVNVTTDKCYENKEWEWGYRENEPLGGFDPYSSSKACSEIVTAAYRNSFFNPTTYEKHKVAIATARAGNVIGGGDWAEDRLIPDFVRAIVNKQKIVIRSPHAIRPWQHVLEPLSGYLLLAQHLFSHGTEYADSWNFGPNDDDAKPVEWIVKKMCEKWKEGVTYEIDSNPQPHEAHYLKLDCSKAKSRLGWYPRWNLETTLDTIIEFTKAHTSNSDLRQVVEKQIVNYFNSVS